MAESIENKLVKANAAVSIMFAIAIFMFVSFVVALALALYFKFNNDDVDGSTLIELTKIGLENCVKLEAKAINIHVSFGEANVSCYPNEVLMRPKRRKGKSL